VDAPFKYKEIYVQVIEGRGLEGFVDALGENAP
jgi:hypothetical protein